MSFSQPATSQAQAKWGMFSSDFLIDCREAREPEGLGHGMTGTGNRCLVVEAYHDANGGVVGVPAHLQ